MTKLLYSHEHMHCPNYEKGKRPLIQVMDLGKDQQLELTAKEDKLIFVREGSLEFSFGSYSGYKISSPKILLLRAGYKFQAGAQEDCSLVLMRVTHLLQLCDCFSLEKLTDLSPDGDSYELSYLEINGCLSDYLDLLTVYIRQGLCCTHFLELKIRELFFIFRAFYSKEELAAFFHLLLTGDMYFSNAVYRHHRRAATARELATLLNYSYSGFIKRFKKVFEQPPYSWMKEQKAHLIRHEINATDKSLNEIATQYGFSSAGRFTDFCKEAFGMAPGLLRKQGKENKEKDEDKKDIKK